MRVVKDRRSSLRVAIDAEVVVYTERDAVEATALDLGMGGLRAQSAWPVRTRRLVVLEVFVRGERLRLDAELMRDEEVEQGHELAFRFVDVEPGAVQQLERVITARLDDGAPRGYAQAFAQGVLGESPPAKAAAAPGANAPEAGGVPQMVPVISGLTQAIVVDAPPVATEGTVVAPAPQPEPGREYTQVLAPERAAVRFDDSWDEDEVDTAQFRRITDDVGPGHTVRLGRDGKPLPPEETAAYTPVRVERVEAEAPPAESVSHPAEPITEPRAPVRRVAVAVPVSVVPEATMALEGARAQQSEMAPPTMRLPFAARMVRLAAAKSSADAQPPREPEGAPAEPEVTPAESEAAEPPREPPSPPPLLRGEVIVPSATERAGAPGPVERRPSQVALEQARAMLRSRPSTGARAPRVIVMIPHRTYRRRGRGLRKR